MGGSNAFGYGSTSDKTTIDYILEDKMISNSKDTDIKVINAANPGYVSYQVLAKLQLRVIDLLPDYAILYMGWNDLFFSSRSEPYERNVFIGKEHYFNMNSWQYYINNENRTIRFEFARPFAFTLFARSAYRNFLNKMTEINIEDGKFDQPKKRIFKSDKLRNSIFEQFYDNLSSIAAILKYRNIQIVFVTLISEYDLYSEDRRDLNSIIKKVALESNSYLIDADRLVSMNKVAGINHSNDQYHLSDKGNEYLADLLAATFKNIMNE
jgi:lysophospholipase L1-like esterase